MIDEITDHPFRFIVNGATDLNKLEVEKKILQIEKQSATLAKNLSDSKWDWKKEDNCIDFFAGEEMGEVFKDLKSIEKFDKDSLSPFWNKLKEHFDELKAVKEDGKKTPIAVFREFAQIPFTNKLEELFFEKKEAEHEAKVFAEYGKVLKTGYTLIETVASFGKKSYKTTSDWKKGRNTSKKAKQSKIWQDLIDKLNEWNLKEKNIEIEKTISSLERRLLEDNKTEFSVIAKEFYDSINDDDSLLNTNTKTKPKLSEANKRYLIDLINNFTHELGDEDL